MYEYLTNICRDIEGGNVKYLDLKAKYLTDSAITFISNSISISSCPPISINLRENFIHDFGVQSLTSHLKSSCKFLDLSSNMLGSEGAIIISNYLKSSQCQLVHLNLSKNSLGSDGTKALAKSFRINTTIQHLFLSEVFMSDEGAMAFAVAFEQNKNLKLKSVDFSSNNMADLSCIALCKAWSIQNTLEFLSLKGNQIGKIHLDNVSAAHALRDLMRSCSRLKSLVLDQVSMDCVDSSVVLSGLTSECKIEEMWFGGTITTLNDECVTVLAEALRTNTSLRKLALSMRGDTTRLSLLEEALECNYTLCDLTLPVYASDMVHINFLIERNRRLQWHVVQPRLLDVAMALSPLWLPPYVLLEIVDWLPFIRVVNRKRKIDLFVAVKKSVEHVIAARKLN